MCYWDCLRLPLDYCFLTKRSSWGFEKVVSGKCWREKGKRGKLSPPAASTLTEALSKLGQWSHPAAWTTTRGELMKYQCCDHTVLRCSMTENNNNKSQKPLIFEIGTVGGNPQRTAQCRQNAQYAGSLTTMRTDNKTKSILYMLRTTMLTCWC